MPWIVASEVVPNHVRTAAMSVAIGVNWLFSFTISKITPIMLSHLHYGTFLIFGIMCIIMACWAYVALPETAGVALEDVRFLFGEDGWVRSLQDAPGGRWVLGGKRARSVDELRREADERERVERERVSEDGSDVKKSRVAEEEDVRPAAHSV